MSATERWSRSHFHLLDSVFITAHMDKALLPRLLERGAVTCLLKPFSEDDLRDAIHAAVEA